MRMAFWILKYSKLRESNIWLKKIPEMYLIVLKIIGHFKVYLFNIKLESIYV